MDFWLCASLFLYLFTFFCEARVILQVTVIGYNSHGKDINLDCCDKFGFICNGQCEPRFKFCLDFRNGDANSDHCAYYGPYYTPDHYSGNYVTVDYAFPIDPILPDQWQRGFRLKVFVWDADFTSGDDEMDGFANQVYIPTIPSQLEVELRGWRSDPSQLYIKYNVMCAPHYYGSIDCSIYCAGQDSMEMGHYSCDPQTGQKICLPGWEDPSKDCKIKVDNCEGVDCGHGACLDMYNDYFCECDPGYTGQGCETDVDECASEPCLNQGSCQDGIDEFFCSCAPEYVGDTCALHVCDVKECFNNGSCVVEGDETRCYCTPQYTGETCRTEICEVLDCSNRGTCDPLEGACICAPGMMGRTCDVDICDHRKCLNNGTCFQGDCFCPDGLTGSFCELSVNECKEETPCENEGVCEDLFIGYKCHCSGEYEGKNCTDHVPVPGSNSTEPGLLSTPRNDNLQAKAAFVILIVVVLVIIIIVIFVCRRKRNRGKSPPVHAEPTSPSVSSNPMFTAGSVSRLTSVSSEQRGALPDTPDAHGAAMHQSKLLADGAVANPCRGSSVFGRDGSVRAVENEYADLNDIAIQLSPGDAKASDRASATYTPSYATSISMTDESSAVYDNNVPSACDKPKQIDASATDQRQSDYAVPSTHVNPAAQTNQDPEIACNAAPDTRVEESSPYYSMERGLGRRRGEPDLPSHYITAGSPGAQKEDDYTTPSCVRMQISDDYVAPDRPSIEANAEYENTKARAPAGPATGHYQVPRAPVPVVTASKPVANSRDGDSYSYGSPKIAIPELVKSIHENKSKNLNGVDNNGFTHC